MSMRRGCLAALLTFVSSALAQVSAPASTATSPVISFTNGLWFDGEAFRSRIVFSVHGVLAESADEPVTKTVDLHGGFIIPPFGDAHEHNFSSLRTARTEITTYLHDGIFYAQGVTEPVTSSAPVRPLVNRPDSVDVTYAHGGLTGDQGHPKEVYEALALGYYGGVRPSDYVQQIRASSRREGDAYWVIDTPQQLEAKWPKILAGKPDLIKVYLTRSEDDLARRAQTDKVDQVGLHPAMVRPIVVWAHAARLKVVAHVDTEADFRTALLAGVDEMAHLPGYCISAKEDPKTYRLTNQDISLAARRHVSIIVTASVCDNSFYNRSDEDKAATRALQVEALRQLRNAHVPVLVGSDSYGSDSQHELAYLASLGVWSSAELLRLSTETTDRDIFPHRKIGTLTPGSEASFLVLKSNPLERWSATQEIVDRWKDGRHLPEEIVSTQ